MNVSIVQVDTSIICTVISKIKKSVKSLFGFIQSKLFLLGLIAPLKLLDSKRYPNLLDSNTTNTSDLKKLKLTIEAELRRAHQIQTNLKYLNLNRIEQHSNDKIKIAFLVNSLENQLILDVMGELYDSAAENGFDCKFFLFSNDIQHSNISTNYLLKIDYLADIEKFEPHLVFAEAHSNSLGNLTKEIEMLNRIKSKINFKFYLISIDIWREYDIDCIKKWESIYDLLVHLDQQSADHFNIKNAFWWPYFGHNKIKILNGEGKPKKYDVMFSGNLNFPQRRFWLYSCLKIAKTYRIKLKIHSLNYRNGKFKPRAVYLSELMTSRSCLNHTWKKSNFTLITFRTFDVITLGGLLLQQEDEHSKPLRDFLTPYKHYIPFSSIAELEVIFQIMKDSPELIEDIGKNGREFFEKHYSSFNLWQILLSKLKSSN